RLRLRYALFPPTPPFLCSCSAPPRDLHSFPTRRSSDLLTCATVSPRYSVRTAPFELWNSSLSSAIAASLSALAMRPPSDYLGCKRPSPVPWGGPWERGRSTKKRPGAGAHGASRQGAEAKRKLSSHLRRPPERIGTFGHLDTR